MYERYINIVALAFFFLCFPSFRLVFAQSLFLPRPAAAASLLLLLVATVQAVGEGLTLRPDVRGLLLPLPLREGEAEEEQR